MTNKKFLNIGISILLCFVIWASTAVTASAYTYDTLDKGSYAVNAELSCYVNAMGGVEFGAPLLNGAVVDVDDGRNKTMTLYFGKSSVTIYDVTCDTFIDGSAGTLGYYTKSGSLSTADVTYTKSSEKVENPEGKNVNYVDSMTFPIAYESGTYELSLYVNSNVMGTQFDQSNYPATLTVDWSSLPEKEATGESVDESSETASSSTGSTEVEPVQEQQEQSEATAQQENDQNESKMGTEAEAKADAEKASEKANLDDEENGTVLVEPENVLAYFNQPLLIGATAVGIILLVGGVLLLLYNRKGNK